MALINKKVEDKKEKLKIEISANIIDEIKEYMVWADLSDINYFIEESVSHIFNSDRDWKKYKKSNKNKSKEITE